MKTEEWEGGKDDWYFALKKRQIILLLRNWKILTILRWAKTEYWVKSLWKRKKQRGEEFIRKIKLHVIHKMVKIDVKINDDVAK